jgi:hypothetical protein
MDIPIVLHCNSGIPEPMLRQSFSLRIKKLNAGTEIRSSFTKGFVEGIQGGSSIFSAFERGRARVGEFVRQKIVVNRPRSRHRGRRRRLTWRMGGPPSQPARSRCLRPRGRKPPA